jgi:hypothetical protein
MIGFVYCSTFDDSWNNAYVNCINAKLRQKQQRINPRLVGAAGIEAHAMEQYCLGDVLTAL